VKASGPHSVPTRLDREGLRFRLSPHSVPLESPPRAWGAGSVPRDSDSCRVHVRGAGNSVGTGGSPSRLASSPTRRRPAVPRFQRLGVPPWQSGSESGPSPIQRRATAAERDALRGENAGSLRGVRVRKLSRRPSFRGGGGASTRRTLPLWERGREASPRRIDLGTRCSYVAPRVPPGARREG
jgi:hypothetical protein